jgi:hypothetical protein
VPGLVHLPLHPITDNHLVGNVSVIDAPQVGRKLSELPAGVLAGDNEGCRPCGGSTSALHDQHKLLLD